MTEGVKGALSKIERRGVWCKRSEKRSSSYVYSGDRLDVFAVATAANGGRVARIRGAARVCEINWLHFCAIDTARALWFEDATPRDQEKTRRLGIISVVK
jgi:hypothetical protein